MRLFLLTSLTMVAFAANSILNRVAVADGDMDPIGFGVLRLVSGALMLGGLMMWHRRALSVTGPGRRVGTTSLLLYIFGFSLAYQTLDAGLGALILFGMVQITMFAGSWIEGERPGAQRLSGAALAFVGLCWLLWPGQGFAPSLSHAALMAVAGIGWGIYSLNGRRAGPPLENTAGNFLLAAAFALFGYAAITLAGGIYATAPTTFGIAIAILSGAVTSGLGYALWYSVLPQLRGSTASIAQLTVPVIAIVAGALFLAEPVDARLVAAATLVLGGVLLAVTSRR
jgi:drug/metabolite transporter (DMT)-like permease